jgi:hypothetical protein
MRRRASNLVVISLATDAVFAYGQQQPNPDRYSPPLKSETAQQPNSDRYASSASEATAGGARNIDREKIERAERFAQAAAYKTCASFDPKYAKRRGSMVDQAALDDPIYKLAEVSKAPTEDSGVVRERLLGSIPIKDLEGNSRKACEKIVYARLYNAAMNPPTPSAPSDASSASAVAPSQSTKP